MTEETLKACPFCGSGLAVPFGRFTQASFSGVELLYDGHVYSVDCGTCGCTTGGRLTEADARKDWNTRTDTETLKGEPVAWMYESDSGDKVLLEEGRIESARKLLESGFTETPLYAAPQPHTAPHRIGRWMSAALDGPKVCGAMKDDIRDWMAAGEPAPSQAEALRFYADPGNYECGMGDVTISDYPVMADGGNAARIALAGHTAPKDDAGTQRLAERVKVLEEALRPFAEFIEGYDKQPNKQQADEIYCYHSRYGRFEVRLSDCRAARSALTEDTHND